MKPVLETAAPDRRLSPATRARLGTEVLRTYARVRWLLWRRELPDVVEAIEAAAPACPTAADEAASLSTSVRLARSTNRCLGVLPTDSRCLVKSLVLMALMARRGIAAVLVIGVRPGDAFAAHAWVERHGVPLLPAGGEEYARLLELGRQAQHAAG